MKVQRWRHTRHSVCELFISEITGRILIKKICTESSTPKFVRRISFGPVSSQQTSVLHATLVF
jgi:hypothetical protein